MSFRPSEPLPSFPYQPRPPKEDEVTLREAALSLARFFDGVVFDEQGQRVLDASIAPSGATEIRTAEELLPAAAESCFLEAIDDEATPDSQALGGQLSLFSGRSTQTVIRQVSLNELRGWYRTAQILGHPAEQLQRIVRLGNLFKQRFGVHQPDAKVPFPDWSEQDIEQWQKDMNRRTSSLT